MKVVILSDTHMPKKAKKLPDRLTEELKEAELILHAGDWQTLDVVKELEQYAPVEGVAGNVDNEEIIERFGQKKTVQAGDITIGLVHGDGKSKTTTKRAWEAFQGEEVDILVFGHSHIPFHESYGKTVMFNPGSPTDKRRQKEYSFGILQTEPDFKLEHIFFI